MTDSISMEGVAIEIRALRETVIEIRSDLKAQGQTNVPRTEFDARLSSMDVYLAGLSERIRKQEDRSEWLVRTVGGALIAAIISVILVIGKIN